MKNLIKFYALFFVLNLNLSDTAFAKDEVTQHTYPAAALSTWINSNGQLVVATSVEQFVETSSDDRETLKKHLFLRQEIESARLSSGVAHLHLSRQGKKLFLWVDSAQQAVGIDSRDLEIKQDPSDKKTLNYFVRQNWSYSEFFDNETRALETMKAHQMKLEAARKNLTSIRFEFSDDSKFVLLKEAAKIDPSTYATQLMDHASKIQENLTNLNSQIELLTKQLNEASKKNDVNLIRGIEKQLETLYSRRSNLKSEMLKLR